MKSVVITARISEEENQELNKLVCESGLKKSSFIKKTLLNKNITIINDTETVATNKKLLMEINKIGNNLNQLVKLLNAKEKSKTITEKDLTKALVNINSISNYLISKVR